MLDEDTATIPAGHGEDKQFEDVIIYKHWFKTKSRGGFLSIKDALDIGKVVIDIGATKADGTFEGATQCYIDSVGLAVYLRAITGNYADELYPADEKANLPTPEAIAIFGGGERDGKVISRVFKAHQGDNPAHFFWKCGHFKGNKTASGAIIPQEMDKPLSVNSIRVTRKQIAEISYRLDLAITTNTIKVGLNAH